MYPNIRYTITILLICFLSTQINAQFPNQQSKPRIVITADPELDDNIPAGDH